MADALRRAGCVVEGESAINAVLARAERSEERWITAGLLHSKGEFLLLQSGTAAAAAAEGPFRQALDRARQQAALSWELRAATSLARLWRDQDKRADVEALLQPIYERFTEGFETADLKAAKVLLQVL